MSSLVLRELTLSDVSPRYVGWLNDPEVTRFLETRHESQTTETVTTFVTHVCASDTEFLFGIFVDGLHIGNLKIGPIRRFHSLADVSIFIGDRDFWGRGYATQAIMSACDVAFKRFGLRKLQASMYATNAGSFKAFLKAGFIEEGRRPNHYLIDGAPCDLIEMGRFA